MKIRQAPVADLLKYLNNLYDTRPKTLKVTNILNLIDKYYCSITNHKTISPIGGDYMNDWCDLNHSDCMDNCPNVPGIIVYKNKPNGTRQYAILYHSGYISSPRMQTNFLSYYYAHPEGHINSHTYLASDWDGWGAPVRYFSFSEEDYIDSRFWALGERPLTINSYGHDVRQLQGLLKRAHPEIPVDGYFESNTLEALHETQSWCNIPLKDIFRLDSEGNKIIEFLTNDYKIKIN